MTTNSTTYCNQKFWWLNVDIQKNRYASCCAADYEKIDLGWLRQNRGQLFNLPQLQQERQDMLANRPAQSCGNACYRPEGQGNISRRQAMASLELTHTNPVSNVELLNIVIGNDCNMTCVYCCKFYSSAWMRDVDQKSYPVHTADDRFTVNTMDRVLTKVGQKDLRHSEDRNFLINELHKLFDAGTVKSLVISGGEPFLHVDLLALLQNIPSTVPVEIYTGLGVDSRRFASQLESLGANVSLTVSAENIEKAYEFVRHGNTWSRFCANLDMIKQRNLPLRYNATVSNITLPGLADFVDFAHDSPVTFSLCTDPDFLNVSVLDPETKQSVSKNHLPWFVTEAINQDPTLPQITNFKSYVLEFAQRRDLTLDVLPGSMIKWIQS